MKIKKKIKDWNHEERSFKLVIFGDIIAKLNIIKCDGDRASNFSQSGAKVKDIYNRIQHFKNKHEDLKIEKIVIQVGTNHL